MIDPFLLSAPILLLGVAALLRFVGCSFTPQFVAPVNFTSAQPQTGAVELVWSEEATDPTTLQYGYTRTHPRDGTSVQIGPITANGTFAGNTPNGSKMYNYTYVDSGLTNGDTYTYQLLMIGDPYFNSPNFLSAIPVNLLGRQKFSTFNSAAPLANNMVALFLMNEGSDAMQGTSAGDLNIVDDFFANPSGAQPPTWVVADPSIQFNGGAAENSYLDCGVDHTLDDLTSGQFTVVAKINLDSVVQGGICEKNDGKPPNSDSGFIFAITPTGGLHVKVECSTQSMVLETNPILGAAQWVQVAFTWDGTQYNGATAPEAACSVFVNGQDTRALNQINAANSRNGTGTLNSTHLANNNSFRIGTVGYDFASSFAGRIAYVAVYKGRLLSTTELSALDANLPIHQPSFG